MVCLQVLYDSVWSVWLCMILCGSMYGSVWFCVVLYDYMVLHVSVWFCVVLYDSVRFFIVMYDSA